MRASRDDVAVKAALDALEDGARNPNFAHPEEGLSKRSASKARLEGSATVLRDEASTGSASPQDERRGGERNLLALAVECARARCSLGEISDALERVFGRYATSPTPVSGIYGQRDDKRWSDAVAGTVAVAQRLGRKPRMLVAKMGQDGHDRGANLVSSAFGDLGFEIVPGPLFQTPREAAEMAVAKAVDVVGASSLAAGHKTLMPRTDRCAPRYGPGGHQGHRRRGHPGAGLCHASRGGGAGDLRAGDQPRPMRRTRCCGC